MQTYAKDVQAAKLNVCHNQTTKSPYAKVNTIRVSLEQNPELPSPSALAARVVLCVQLLEAFACHVGVDGGGGNIGMAQQQLHHAQIGAVVEQVGGKGMAQRVR